ncbi:hypothetical protein ACLB1E_31920 [Escherichia coli]
MNWRHCWVVLKWNIWATTLKASEQAAKKELNYREFLCMALQQEWNGRHGAWSPG